MPPQTSAAGRPSVRCGDITGLDCDFLATPDESGPGAKGEVATQVIASLTYHLFYKHPEQGLGADERRMIRERLSAIS